MKKLTILFVALVMVGCTCIGQIPDQVIYMGEDCTAPLPDYIPRITVTDNCDSVTVRQDPLPGTLLTSSIPLVTVTITATDVSNNETNMTFEVVAVDTIPPAIVFDSIVDLSASMEFKGNLLDIFYNSVYSDLEYTKEYGPDSMFISEETGSIANPFKNVDIGGKTLVIWKNEDDAFGAFYPPYTDVCFCDSSDFYVNSNILSFK